MTTPRAQLVRAQALEAGKSGVGLAVTLPSCVIRPTPLHPSVSPPVMGPIVSS